MRSNISFAWGVLESKPFISPEARKHMRSYRSLSLRRSAGDYVSPPKVYPQTGPRCARTRKLSNIIPGSLKHNFL